MFEKLNLESIKFFPAIFFLGLSSPAEASIIYGEFTGIINNTNEKNFKLGDKISGNFKIDSAYYVNVVKYDGFNLFGNNSGNNFVFNNFVGNYYINGLSYEYRPDYYSSVYSANKDSVKDSPPRGFWELREYSSDGVSGFGVVVGDKNLGFSYQKEENNLATSQFSLNNLQYKDPTLSNPYAFLEVSGPGGAFEAELRFRGQRLTEDSSVDSRLSFGGGIGRVGWTDGRRMGDYWGIAAA